MVETELFITCLVFVESIGWKRDNSFELDQTVGLPKSSVKIKPWLHTTCLTEVGARLFCYVIVVNSFFFERGAQWERNRRLPYLPTTWPLHKQFV